MRMESLKRSIKSNPYLERIIRPVYELFKPAQKRSEAEAPAAEPEAVPPPPACGRKVIYFDITSYSVTDVRTGIQRVVAKFLEHLEEMVRDEYDLVCISGLGDYHIIEKETFQPRWDLPLAPHEGDLYLSIDSNPVQPCEYWDTLRAWQQAGCKLIACVYDLVYIKYPQYVSDEAAVSLLSRWLAHAAENFDGLVCISKTVEDELIEWIAEQGIQNSKLRTGYFHQGSDFGAGSTQQTAPVQALFARICRDKPMTFLSVATIEPRKGYPDLVSAFQGAARAGVDAILVIVGRIGWKYDDIVARIADPECHGTSVFWFSDCDDDVLDVLYQLSDCYISGSYYEGFGLGIIEAARKGLPVLLRDIPVNREVSQGKGAYYKDTQDLIEMLKRISEDPEILNGQEKIDTLSWKESVAAAWRTIQNMIQVGRT